MKWLKQWIRSVANSPEEWDIKGAKPEPVKRGPPTSLHDVIGHMSHSMAVIYRIDNGFIMSINMNSANHDTFGQRGACVYAKDASELAEKVIAHETAFKIGVRSGGLGASVQVDKYASGAALTPGAFPSRI